MKRFNDAKRIANGYEIPCYVNVMDKLAGVAEKWYRDYMLPNYTSCVKRKVRIDNSELRKNNKVCQLVDGDYICLFINIDVNIVKQRLGRKRIFSEDAFLHTQKYDVTQYYEREYMQYYDIYDRHVFQSLEGFGSAWGRNASYLTIVMPYYNEWVIDQLIDSIKKGEIAFVQEEPSLFNNIGGLLVNVKDACNLNLLNLCR